MQPKHLFESKTVWLALASMLIALAGAAPALQAFITQFFAENPVDWSDLSTVIPWVLLLVKGVIDIVLRSITKQPVKL